MHTRKEWLNKQKFLVFGAGQLGANLMFILQHYNSFLCYIDNDAKKQNENWREKPVLSLQAAIHRYKEYKIVVASSVANKKSIDNQLVKAGLISGEDYLYIEDFIRNVFPFYVFENFKENFISLAQICVTERCTLKCKKCAHGCYAVPAETADMPIDFVKYSADCFFSHIDYIDKFHLIGGEPFLYRDLAEAIMYIGDNYIQNIQTLCITTNGTIVPKEDVLVACKKYNVKILISNYTYSLPKLEKQYNKFVRILDDYGIDFVLGDADKEWTDYGFDYVDRGLLQVGVDSQASQEKLRKVFSDCKTPCREIRGNRLYYCVQARACAENLGFQCGQDDYLDLNRIGDSYEGKKKLVDFEIGNIKKGYLDMCNYCHGSERFRYIIPAAEQKEV